MMAAMTGPHDRPSRSVLWAGALGVAIVAAAAWVMLGWALRDECDPTDGGCDDWVVADAVATAVAVAMLFGWAVTGRRRAAWLAVGTAALLVPLVHVLGV